MFRLRIFNWENAYQNKWESLDTKQHVWVGFFQQGWRHYLDKYIDICPLALKIFIVIQDKYYPTYEPSFFVLYKIRMQN